jgi:hypothetical protein
MFANLLNVIDPAANAIVAVLDGIKFVVEALLGGGYVGAIVLILLFFFLLAGPLYYMAVKNGVG